MRNRMGSFKRKFVVASASALALGLAGLGTLPIYNNGVNVVQALEGYAKAAFSNKDEVESNVLVQQAKAEAQSKVSASWQVRTVEEVKTEIERQKAAGYPAYVIQWGDTLGVIAAATNQSVADLAAVNQLTDVDRILTGDVLTGVLDKATIAEAKNVEAQRGGASTEPNQSNQATQVTRTQEKGNVPSDKLVGSMKPAEESKPSDSVKPAEESKVSDPVKPAEESKVSDPVKPAEESKVSDPVKPAEESKPSDPVKPAEESKPEETQPTPSESSSSEESKPAEPTPSEEPTTPEKPVEEFKAMPWKFTGKVDEDGIGEFEDPREFATEDEAVAYGYSMIAATGKRTDEEASASLQRATGGAQFKEGTTSSGFESTQGMDNPNWTVFHKIEMSQYLNK